MKLGRKVVTHVTQKALFARRLFSKYLVSLGPAPQESPDWLSAVKEQSPDGWGMFGNDQYGDCVFADCAHQEMLRTANTGKIWIPTVEEVLALYSTITGFNPSDSSTDNGANESDVIAYLTNTGWQGRKLDIAVNIDPTQFDFLRWAVCLGGACRLGVNLPQSAIDQFNSGHFWSFVQDSPMVGGHDVPLVQYTQDSWKVITWGQEVEVSGDFMDGQFPDGTPYIEEAHCELAFDWATTAGICPNKETLSQIISQLNQLNG